MAKIDVYTSEMSSLSARLKKISSVIENAEQVTEKVQSNLDFRVAAKADIASALSRTRKQLRQQKDKVVKMADLTTASAAEFRNADGQMDKSARNILGKIVAPLTNVVRGVNKLFVGAAVSRYRSINSLFMPAGTIITVAGISELIRRLAQIINGWKQQNTDSTTGTISGAGSGANTGAATTPTDTKPPQMTQEEKDQQELDIINARYKTLPSAAKGPDAFTGNCGAFVFQQLLVQGIVTKTGKYESTGHAKDYAGVLAKKDHTSTGHQITSYGSGDDAFDRFLAANQGKSPLTNIVCSFKKGTTTGNQTHGHAMLISKIENGKVYYVDNRSECRQSDGYAARCITIEEFKKIYFKKGNNCTGITQIE